MVLACALEPLRAVRDQGRENVEWSILALAGEDACSSSGLRMAADCPVEHSRRCDVLIVIAGYGYREHASPKTRRLLRTLSRPATG